MDQTNTTVIVERDALRAATATQVALYELIDAQSFEEWQVAMRGLELCHSRLTRLVDHLRSRVKPK